MHHVPRMREDHLKFSSELAKYSNEVTTTYKETPRTDKENRYIKNILSVHVIFLRYKI